MLPGILSQLGMESLTQLMKLASLVDECDTTDEENRSRREQMANYYTQNREIKTYLELAQLDQSNLKTTQGIHKMAEGSVVQGGLLIWHGNHLMLLEIAHVPKDDADEFKSVSKFKIHFVNRRSLSRKHVRGFSKMRIVGACTRIFNTKNLWGRLDANMKALEKQELEMEITVNIRHVDRGIDVIGGCSWCCH
ncbi:unnamed protein product [Toxocara canis]|uniref:DNA-directed RNA polymerase n=1 Tax=Toxocara canis TaxID=6265 RepID=A0A183VFC7_TOXCA|nr:unnamed protein product [Toxocara canis]